MVFELKFLDSCTSNKSITIGRKCRKVQLFCRNSNSSFSAALSLNSSNVSIDNFLFRQKFRWNPLLVFGAYVICKKNYSSRRVVFLFFSIQNCQLLLSKNKWQQWVRTTGFSSIRSGFVLVVPNNLLISLTSVKNSIPMVPIPQWVGQQSSEATG